MKKLRGDGNFLFKVAGTSFYRDEISSLIVGDATPMSIHHVDVVLIPVDSNPHDDMAVEIRAGNSVLVGHVPTRAAKRVREVMASVSAKQVTCRAVVSGGGRKATGEHLDFSIRLDLDLSRYGASSLDDGTQVDSVRVAKFEWVRSSPLGLCVARCWLSEPRYDFHPSWSVTRWMRPGWKIPGYFARDPRGIGLGLWLFNLERDVECSLFGDLEVAAEIISMDGRLATINLQAVSEDVPFPRVVWDGGRPLRGFLARRDALGQISGDLTKVVAPAQRIGLARMAVMMQYEMIEIARVCTDEGSQDLLREVGFDPQLSSTFIRPLVTSLIECGDHEAADAELRKFLLLSPSSGRNQLVNSLHRLIRVPIRSSRRDPV